MKYIPLLLLLLSSVSFAREQLSYTVTASTTSGLYQVYKGTFVYTEALSVSTSNVASFTPRITIDGINGNVTATKFYGDGSSLSGVLGTDTACRVSTGTMQVQISAIAVSTGTLYSKSGGDINGDINLSALQYRYLMNNNAAIQTSSSATNTYFFAEAGNQTASGDKNYGIGGGALYSLTTGDKNIAFGKEALYSNLSGGNNTAIGHYALYSATGSNNIAIGYAAGYPEKGSNKLYINSQNFTTESDARTKSLMYGEMAAAPDNQFLNINATVTVSGNMTAAKYYGDGSNLTGVSAGVSISTYTPNIIHIGGEIYVASGAVCPIVGGMYRVQGSTWYITGIEVYTLNTSTTGSSFFNVAYSTETGNTTAYSYMTASPIEVSTNTKTSGIVSQTYTAAPSSWIWLEIVNAPSTGNIPSEFGLVIRYFRKD